MKLLFPKFKILENLRNTERVFIEISRSRKGKLIKLKIYEYNGKFLLSYKCFGENSRENLEKLGYTYFAKISEDFKKF